MTVQARWVTYYQHLTHSAAQASPSEDYNLDRVKSESMLVVLGYGIFVTIVTTMCARLFCLV